MIRGVRAEIESSIPNAAKFASIDAPSKPQEWRNNTRKAG